VVILFAVHDASWWPRRVGQARDEHVSCVGAAGQQMRFLFYLKRDSSLCAKPSACLPACLRLPSLPFACPSSRSPPYLPVCRTVVAPACRALHCDVCSVLRQLKLKRTSESKGVSKERGASNGINCHQRLFTQRRTR
jgi:hypothetical protein